MKSAWWMNDTDYTEDAMLHPNLDEFATGPLGPALVRAWPNGSTTKGWGEKEFMQNYHKGRFMLAPFKAKYEIKPFPVAYVMRSFQIVCIDIDGKNGGFEHAGLLGMLPYTLAETSKSGTGYHLFYSTPAAAWDADKGFGKFPDSIGIVQGVDIRGTGCVYHYPNQRWNGKNVAPLPEHLEHKLLQRKSISGVSAETLQLALGSGAEKEIALMQYQLTQDLEQPIPRGKRNITLFAIGSKMYLMDVPDWDSLVHARALAVGLDIDEADKLVANISKYAVKDAP